MTVGTADVVRDNHRLGGRLRAVAALVVLAVAVLVAGCGGGSGLTVASMPGVNATGRHLSSSRPGGGGGGGFVGSGPSPAQLAAGQVSGLRFSRCMRAHGVPNFPDPPSASVGGYGPLFGAGGIDPNAPLFRVAQRSCVAIINQQAPVVVP